MRAAGNPWQQQGKFVTADAGDGVDVPCCLHHDPGRGLQHVIPRRMAQAIVHRLEVIQIDLHHGKPLVPRDKPRQHVIHRAPVFQTGQRIGKRLLLRRDLCDLKLLVQRTRCRHRRRLCLHQIKHLDREVGRREIGIAQAMGADAVQDRYPE